MINNSEIRFIDKRTQDSFYKLKQGDKSEKELYKILNQALDNIENNAFCGIQIPKRLISKYYVKKYTIKNLWKYDLPKGWRLIYTITGGDIVIVCLLLEWLSHKDYENRFNY